MSFYKAYVCFFAAVMLLLAAASVASTSDGNAPPTFSDKEKKLLDEGRPVKRRDVQSTSENSAGRGFGYIRVKGTPEEIYHYILDYDHYAEFYPFVVVSRIYKKEGNSYFVKSTSNLTPLVSYTNHMRYDYLPEKSQVLCSLDQTQKNDIKEVGGGWRIWPISENESLVEYELYINSGFHAPKVIEDLVGDYGLGKVMTNTKKRVESAGKFKK